VIRRDPTYPVATLTVAREDQLDSIYRESHALWGSGLPIEDYLGLWGELTATAWARRHAGMYVWCDDADRVLSSVKLYRPELRIGGNLHRITVIGALFTPSALRGRGYASALVEAVLAGARERGDPLALLFSDIGTDFYVRLGFRALPAEEQWGALPTEPRPPVGWSLRPRVASDLPAISRAHGESARSRPLAMVRDTRHWAFLDVRSSRFFERLNDRRLTYRQQVALCGREFAGYLITVEGRGEWNVREVGAAEGSAQTMARILRLGARQARAAGLRGFYGWLPPGVAERLPDWRIRRRRRRRAVPMVCALDAGIDLSGLTTADAAYLAFQDQF
jgi:predicted N-acetyltransferase YhbS